MTCQDPVAPGTSKAPPVRRDMSLLPDIIKFPYLLSQNHKGSFFFSGVIRVNREYGEMATLIISVKLSLPSFMLVSGQRYSVV